MIHMDERLQIKIEELTASLLQRCPDHMVFLFCEPDDLSEKILTLAKEWKNLMIVIHYDETTPEVCEMLKEKGISYSVYCSYSEDDLEEIFSGDWFFCTELIQAVFTVLVPAEDCIPETRKAVYEYVQKTREARSFQTIPMERIYDCIPSKGILSYNIHSGKHGN